jgi:sucrose phosphorylase
VGRDINRHYYTPEEIEKNLKRNVVQKLLSLIRFRNSHPAFAGSVTIDSSARHKLSIRWINRDDWARLDVDFQQPHARIEHSNTASDQPPILVIDLDCPARGDAPGKEVAL